MKSNLSKDNTRLTGISIKERLDKERADALVAFKADKEKHNFLKDARKMLKVQAEEMDAPETEAGYKKLQLQMRQIDQKLQENEARGRDGGYGIQIGTLGGTKIAGGSSKQSLNQDLYIRTIKAKLAMLEVSDA